MPLIMLAPAVVAVALSYGSTVVFVLTLANAVASFFAINAMLNLGTLQETGDVIDAWKRS